MLKILNFIFISFLLATKCFSDVVNEINVKNNNRITKETILIFSDIKIGNNYEPNDLDQVIKDLYNTNFFSNITLDLTNGVLTIDVIENKIIQEVEIKGIKKK